MIMSEKKRTKGFRKWNEETKKKEDGSDASLIKWSTPSNGECGEKI